MTIRKVLAAVALLAATASAVAAPVTTTSDVALQTGKTTGFSMKHTVAGDFIDIFNFTSLLDFAVINGSLTTVGLKPTTDIDFFSATLNGIPLSFALTAMTDPSTGQLVLDAGEVGALGKTGMAGPYVLTITGRAGGTLDDGAAINASYGGTFNATLRVPEPASMGLVGIALLGVAAATRRRPAKQA